MGEDAAGLFGHMLRRITVSPEHIMIEQSAPTLALAVCKMAHREQSMADRVKRRIRIDRLVLPPIIHEHIERPGGFDAMPPQARNVDGVARTEFARSSMSYRFAESGK